MKKNIPTDPFLKKLGDRFRQIRIAQGYSNYEQFAFDNELPRAQYADMNKERIYDLAPW